jgi:hypothetical protein
MNKNLPSRTLDTISDEELLACVDGSADLGLIRDLLEDNLNEDGWVYSMDFGIEFADKLGSSDEETWENNCVWAEKIADNINDLLAGVEE